MQGQGAEGRSSRLKKKHGERCGVGCRGCNPSWASHSSLRRNDYPRTGCHEARTTDHGRRPFPCRAGAVVRSLDGGCSGFFELEYPLFSHLPVFSPLLLIALCFHVSCGGVWVWLGTPMRSVAVARIWRASTDQKGTRAKPDGSGRGDKQGILALFSVLDFQLSHA